MQRHHASARRHRARRPGRQAEMGVHDVEALAAEPASELTRGPRVGAVTAGLEREHVELDVVEPLQRPHLVADKAAERRPLGRRVHVGDDQRAHPRWRLGEPGLAGRSATMRTMRPELPVAVFDSGVGGLTVLHELLVSLPTEDYLYLGDTARLPVRQPERARAPGASRSRSPSTCSPRAPSCSSSPATRRRAAALPELEAHLRRTGRDVDVIGVLAPAAQLAVAASRSGRIGLLATAATVGSRRLRAHDPRGRPARAARERRLSGPGAA